MSTVETDSVAVAQSARSAADSWPSLSAASGWRIAAGERPAAAAAAAVECGRKGN